MLGRTSVSACVVEVRTTAAAPVDLRILETNAAFDAQDRLWGAKGRWARDLLPGLAEEVYAAFRNVVLTGQASEVEVRSTLTGGRTVRICTCRLGRPKDKLVGVILVDLTSSAPVRQEH